MIYIYIYIKLKNFSLCFKFSLRPLVVKVSKNSVHTKQSKIITMSIVQLFPAQTCIIVNNLNYYFFCEGGMYIYSTHGGRSVNTTLNPETRHMWHIGTYHRKLRHRDFKTDKKINMMIRTFKDHSHNTLSFN